MFTFTSHVPHCQKTIKDMIRHNTELTLSSNHVTTMQIIYDLLVASEGAVTKLIIPDLSILFGRDAHTLHIPRLLCQQLQDLRVILSFQPKAHVQLEAVNRLLTAPDLERLELKATEHQTNAFLGEEKYRMPDDEAATAIFTSKLAPLPDMVNLLTPAQARLKAVETDGAKYGNCVHELLTGTRKLPAPADDTMELEDAIRNLFERASHADEVSAPVQAGVQPPPGSELSKSDVRAAASVAMAEMNAHQELSFMTKCDWNSGIAILLKGPLSPSLEHLSMQVIIPAPLPPPCCFLSGLICLETLHLTYCGIEDATLEALMPDITGLFSLRVLDLARNRLSEADLRPLGSGMHSLERLILAHNNLGGKACAGLLGELNGNNELSHIDLSYNRVNTEGLRFVHLEGWTAPSVRLVLPDVFSPEEVDCINARMPNNSTLELVGWAGDGFMQDATGGLLN